MVEKERVSEWVESIEDELEDHAGTDDYLEVVERAERPAKYAENLANISEGPVKNSSAQSNS